MPQPTRIASHRGGAFLWPENSAMAFRETARLPLEQCECDVHLSADGEVVVMHDATLDRMTDGRGPVAAQSMAELRRLRIRGTGGEAVPTLAEFADILRGSSVDPRVEIKSDGQGNPYTNIVPRTLAVLDAAGVRQRSWIIGFHAGTMAEALRAGGVAGVAWLLETSTLRDIGVSGMVAVARAHGFPEVGLHQSAVDAELVATLRQAGLGIGVWGANHAPSIRRMMEIGVDILATDDPPLAIELRRR
jgi:glycerophosphoryl diester phosphodiesterase